MRVRHIIMQGAVATLLITACGGDDSADPVGTTSGEDPTVDASAGQSSDGESGESDDTAVAEPADDDGAGDDSASDDGAGDDGAGDDATDTSDVDWASVDLTTIDWANVDLDDVDLAAVEGNPTVGDISEEDLAIISQLNAARFGSGNATLAVGDRTWTLEGFQCAFESSGLLNEGTTLGTNLIGEADGVRIQMQIDVYDDGAAQFTMDDIDDFENPSISYLETTDIDVSVDGNTIRAAGDVTDEASGNFDIVPMTFEGECGPDSAR